MQEINASSREQESGAEQINKAIQQLDRITQQNASASEEMASTAEELSAQASQLQGAVAFFKIGGETGETPTTHHSFARRKPVHPQSHFKGVTSITYGHRPGKGIAGEIL